MATILKEFILESSLYESIEYTDELAKQLFDILDSNTKFEQHCHKCETMRVFKLETSRTDKGHLYASPEIRHALYCGRIPSELLDFRYLYLRYICSLDNTHKMEYFFVLENNNIIKVGQFPSIADVSLSSISKYKKTLDQKYSKELRKAIGLYAHGVGIGSFVYLRRIIEKLVYDAFKEAESAGELTKERFEFKDEKHRNKMEEKIKLLRGFLPDTITDSPKIYGIVSKGIHELSEEECLEYFPILQMGIFLILDDIVARQEKVKAEDEYKKSLGGIVADLG